MTENNEEVLRRSLDAVDRHRNRLLVGLLLTVALLVFVFLHGATTFSSERQVVNAVLAHYFMLLIWITVMMLVIVIQNTISTKRILRAIELASKR